MLLGRFSFTLTYRPGSENTKPEALSGQFSPGPADLDPGPILPPAYIVGVVSWQVEESVL